MGDKKDLKLIPEPPEPPAGFAETDKTKALEDKESFFEKLFTKKSSDQKQEEAQQKEESKEEAVQIAKELKKSEGFFSSLFKQKEQESLPATSVPTAVQDSYHSYQEHQNMHNPIPLPEEFEAEVKELEADLQALDMQNSQNVSAIKLIKPITLSKQTKNSSISQNTQKQIIAREQELLSYYNVLKDAESSMNKRYKDIQKREYKLISQEERLKHIEQTLKEKEVELKMREEGSIAAEIQQREIKVMLDREETAIVSKVKELEKDKQAIDDKENELLITLERLELQKRDVNRLTKELDAKEKHLDEREKQFHPSELRLEQKKAELQMKEEEVMKVEKEIKETKALIDKEEQSITDKFNKMELDLKLISEKETEIVSTYKKLTTLKSAVTKREQFVKAKQDEMLLIINENKLRAKELDKISKTLAEKEKIITATLDNLKRYDELVKDKQEMELIVERLQKRVKDEYKKLESIHKMKNRNIDENVAFYHETKDIQKDIHSESENNEQNDSSIPMEELHNVLSTQQSQQAQQDSQAPASITEDVEQRDLLTMIDETNSLIKEKKYNEANTYLGKIMNEYEKIDSSHVKKRELYYEILGLKNEIKLALLKA